MKTFDNVEDLKLAKLKEGQFINTGGYYDKGGPGAAEYFIKTAAQATTDGDVFSASTTGNILLANGNVAVIQADETTTDLNFGVIHDSSTNADAAIAEYAAFCSTKGFRFKVHSADTEVASEILITQQIVFTANVSVEGVGAFLPKFICVNTSLFKWPAGAENVKVTRIRAGQAVRHDVTPNSFSAIEFPGSTGSRPFYNNVEGCFFDGFSTNFNVEWAWEQRYLNNTLIHCGQVVRAIGACVNNHVIGNTATGIGLAFQIGNGTGAIEGWWIKENLLNEFSGILVAVGASFNKINDNIFDHITGTPGILMQSSGTAPTVGNHIKGNYLAFDFDASEGIRLLNQIASAQNFGSTIDDNEIFAYSGFTLAKGILVDGTNELLNVITKNKITAGTADVDLAATALSTIVTDNVFNGAGFTTASNTVYNNNQGIVQSSQTLLRQIVGNNIVVYATNQPSSGTFKAGDVAKRIDPGIDGNNMVLIEWLRLTDGSGHVANVDWAAIRASTVSPAN